MKKAAIVISFIVGVIAVCLGVFGGYYLWASSLPNVYENTYYAALVDKVHYLKEKKDQKKIVLVGGSNVAFGFDSELLENEFPDYQVANFGLYAALGTKIMMDLALPYVGEGDLVFLLPEANAQSMSLFFSPVDTWKAIEDDTEIYDLLPDDNKKQMQGNYFAYIDEKKDFDAPIPGSGVYQRSNFNDRLDFEYIIDGISQRAQNMMSQHYDPSMTVDFESQLFDEAFVSYANEYAEKLSKRGASIYFGFSPVNEFGAVNGDEENLTAYYWSLREAFSFPAVGNPAEYIIDPHYFFDSNFHLNDSGAILRTKLLADDIYRDVFGLAKQADIDIPEEPDYPDIVIGEDSPEAEYFELAENTTGYSIVKVKDEYADMAEISLPMYLNGKVINHISASAFAYCPNLEQIILPRTITSIDNGAFASSYKLSRVILLYDDPSKVQVDFTGGLVDGVVSGFKFLVPESGYAAFVTDYYWGPYNDYIESYEDGIYEKL